MFLWLAALCVAGCQGTDATKSSVPGDRQAALCQRDRAMQAIEGPTARVVRGTLIVNTTDGAEGAPGQQLIPVDYHTVWPGAQPFADEEPPSTPGGDQPPQTRPAGGGEKPVVILIDDSASMAIEPGNEEMSRFEAAKALSEEQLAKLSKDHNIQVVRFRTVDGRDNPKADASALLHDLPTLKAETQPTLDAALEEALRAVSGHASIEVIILTDGRWNVLKVPAAAVFTDGGKTYCRRVKGGAAEKVEVKIGRRNEKEVEIISGLEEGDEVLLTPPPAPQNPSR